MFAIISLCVTAYASLWPKVNWVNTLKNSVWYEYDYEKDTIKLQECDKGLKCDNEHSDSMVGIEIDTDTHYWIA